MQKSDANHTHYVFPSKQHTRTALNSERKGTVYPGTKPHTQSFPTTPHSALCPSIPFTVLTNLPFTTPNHTTLPTKHHQTKPNQKPSIVYTFFAIGSTFHQQVTSVMIIYPEKYQCTQPRHFPKLLHVFKWRYAPTVTPTTADMSPKRRKRNRFLHLRYVRCFPSLPNPCP